MPTTNHPSTRHHRLLVAGVLIAFAVLFGSATVSAVSRQVGSDVNGEFEDDFLGWSVAMNADGTRIVTGSPGMDGGVVQVLDLQAGNWVQVGRDIRGRSGDRLGGAVAVSSNGSRIAVAGDSSYVAGIGWQTGKVLVFDLINGNWTQVGQNLYGREASDYFGDSIALSANGNRLVVGTPQVDAGGSRPGEVRVFDLVADQWTQRGADIDGPSAQSWFGRDVAVSSDGSTIVVGAPAHDGVSFWTGQAQVFEFVGGDWVTLGSPIEGVEMFDGVGRSVAIGGDGTRIAVSSEGSERSGVVEVFDFVDGEWARVGEPISELATVEYSASVEVALSADGTRVIAGIHDDSTFEYSAGKVSAFDFDGENWAQVESSIYGRAEWDWLGRALAVTSDGSRIAVGGNSDTAVARGAGQVRVFDLEQTVVYCDGLEATVVGTAGDDVLMGTVHADVIAGLQGDDVIHGLAGDDIVCGGKGNDVIYGGDGFDILYGAQGDDEIFAAEGSSVSGRQDTRGARMFGGAGDDKIYGSNRWDRMQGGAGTDRLNGYEGRDWMRGGADRDFVIGGSNIDDVHGGSGNDWIDVSGNDAVRGGAGAQDRCRVAAGSVPKPFLSCELDGPVPLPTPAGVEGIDYIIVDG